MHYASATRRRLSRSVAAVLLFLVPNLSGQAQVRHDPPPSFAGPQALILRAESPTRLEWVMAFWKIQDADDYESLKFESADGMTFIGRLGASDLSSPRLTYYLAYKSGDQIRYLPEGAPVEVYAVATAVPAGPAAEKPPAPKSLRFLLDGTVDAAAVKGDSDLATGTMNSQNARLEYGGKAGPAEVTVGARAAYTNQPFIGEDNVDLPELNLTARYRGHSLRMGDISVSESEFTIASFGRRGLEYGLKTDFFELRAFTQSAQIPRGFKGVGIPKNGIALFGGTAAASPVKGLTLRAVVVSGEDDPTLGYNIGVSSIYHKRKGSVFSFIAETALLADSLRIQAEYAMSRFDGNLDDGMDLVSGRAFRLEGTFRRGLFDVRAGYRSVGKDFNTVGLPYLLNDRRGLFGTAGLTLGKFRFGGGFRKEKTNVDDDPDLAVAGLTAGQADVTFSFGTSSSVRFGLSRESQEASFSTGIWNPYPAFRGTLNKTGFTGGLDLGLKSWLRLSLAGERSRLECDQTPAMNGNLTTASLGLQLFLPGKVMVFPCFSYSRVEPAAGTSTRALTAALNGEVTLIRKWLTWNATAFLSEMTPGPGDPVRSIWADTGFNLNLQPVISLGAVILSLRGQVIQTRMSGLTANDFRAAVRLTHAF